MRRSACLVLAVIFATSCSPAISSGATTPSAGGPNPTTAPTPSLTATEIRTPSATPSPTPALVDGVDCTDVDRFIASTHAARLAAAGVTAATSPLPSPTLPPADATLPPLGQFILSSSPVASFTKTGYTGFLKTVQDLGPDVTGQFPALAARTGLLWAYDRTWTGESGPGGFQNYVYEFASAAGAVEFEEGATRGACLNGGTLYEVPGMPGAIGQRYPGGYPDNAIRVSFLKGKRRYVVLMLTVSPTRAETIFEVARIASSTAR